MNETAEQRVFGLGQLSVGAGIGAAVPFLAHHVGPSGQPLVMFVLVSCLLAGACLLPVPALRLWGVGLILGAAALVIAFIMWLQLTGTHLS